MERRFVEFILIFAQTCSNLSNFGQGSSDLCERLLIRGSYIFDSTLSSSSNLRLKLLNFVGKGGLRLTQKGLFDVF